MGRLPSQLPLELTHAPEYGRDSFIAGASNRPALALIERWPNWPGPVVVLSGPGGSGKTHLAHIWTERTGAAIIPATALEARPIGAGRGRALVVEDVAADVVPERALFHVINTAMESGADLLITSRAPVSDWQTSIRDLQSRLRMATPVALHAPDEDLLRKVLIKLFADRQLMVEKALVDYLLVRMERPFSAARALVDALDRQALAAGRRITRPMAAAILSDFEGPQEGFTEPE